jgi:hypothetical protein
MLRVEAETAAAPADFTPSSVVRSWTAPLSAWASRKAAAFVYELNDLAAFAGEINEEPLPAGCGFRLATTAEMPDCAAMAQASTVEYRRRVRCGDQCYAVFQGNRPVNINWLHFGSCYVRGLGLLIEADAAQCYLYNVFTDRACRRQGLYANTQLRLIKALAARGVQGIRQVVMRENTAPQLALPKWRYELAQIVRHRCVLGTRLTSLFDRHGQLLERRLFWRIPTDVYQI